MSMVNSSLSQRMLGLHQSFHQALLDLDAELTPEVPKWVALCQMIENRQAHGNLSDQERSLAHRIASNVFNVGSIVRDLQIDVENEIDILNTDLRTLLLGDRDLGTKRLTDVSLRRVKRTRRPTCFPPSPSNTDYGSSDTEPPLVPIHTPITPTHPNFSPNTPTPTQTPSNANDILRIWFLNNIGSPFPTPLEKDRLAKAMGLPRAKVETDLTNWRRRSGWTDIKDQYADGSREKMQRLIEKVERGKEKREVVYAAVDQMKGYLRREEEEKVGDWVLELAAINPADPVLPPLQNDLHTPQRLASGSSFLTIDSNHGFNGKPSVPSLSSASSFSSLRNRNRRNPSRNTSGSSNASIPFPITPSSGTFPFHPSTSQAEVEYDAFNACIKRLLDSPDNESSRKATRYDYTTTPESEEEERQLAPLWMTGRAYPSTQPSVSTSSTGPNISVLRGRENMVWRTDGELPLLPHMTRVSGNEWKIPEGFEFTGVTAGQ